MCASFVTILMNLVCSRQKKNKTHTLEFQKHVNDLLLSFAPMNT